MTQNKTIINCIPITEENKKKFKLTSRFELDIHLHILESNLLMIRKNVRLLSKKKSRLKISLYNIIDKNDKLKLKKELKGTEIALKNLKCLIEILIDRCKNRVSQLEGPEKTSKTNKKLDVSVISAEGFVDEYIQQRLTPL